MHKRGETMIKELCKDILFLSKKAEDATKDDIQTAQDLLQLRPLFLEEDGPHVSAQIVVPAQGHGGRAGRDEARFI